MYPPIAPILPIRRKDLPPEKDGWAWELRIDGLRGLADTIQGRMLSKNLNHMKKFDSLLNTLPDNCVFDGEICVLDGDGRPQFNDLLFGRGEPVYVVFDLLFYERQDIRSLPRTCDGGKFRTEITAKSKTGTNYLSGDTADFRGRDARGI